MQPAVSARSFLHTASDRQKLPLGHPIAMYSVNLAFVVKGDSYCFVVPLENVDNNSRQ